MSQNPTHYIEVHGPNIPTGVFGVGQTYLINDPDSEVTVLEDGCLEIFVPRRPSVNRDGSPTDRPDVPAKRVLYAKGEWTRVTTGARGMGAGG